MSNSDNNDNNIIKIKLRDKLEQKNIVAQYKYHIPSKSIVISLNHKHTPPINTIFKINIDDWRKNAEQINKILKPRGVDPDDIRQLGMSLDDCWESIYNTYCSSEEEKEKEGEETGQKGNAKEVSAAELLLELIQTQEPAVVLFKDQFNVPHALINIYDHYEVLPIEDTKFRRYLSKLYYDNLKEVPNSEAVRNVVQLLAAKAIFEGETITLHLRAAWSKHVTTTNAIFYDMSDEINISEVLSDCFLQIRFGKRYSSYPYHKDPVSLTNFLIE